MGVYNIFMDLLDQTYRDFCKTTENHQEMGLLFGKLCRELRDQYSAPGRRSKGPTYSSELKDRGIPRRTASRWVLNYEISIGARPKSPTPGQSAQG